MKNLNATLQTDYAIDARRYLNEKQLAQRLNMSVKWCQKQRLIGGGVPFVKFGRGAVRYALDAIEAYERSCWRHSTSDSGSSAN